MRRTGRGWRTATASGGDRIGAIALFFEPAALGEGARSPWPRWRAHPLLFPFLHGYHGGLLRLEVPASRREFWDATVASVDAEVTDRRRVTTRRRWPT